MYTADRKAMLEVAERFLAESTRLISVREEIETLCQTLKNEEEMAEEARIARRAENRIDEEIRVLRSYAAHLRTAEERCRRVEEEIGGLILGETRLYPRTEFAVSYFPELAEHAHMFPVECAVHPRKEAVYREEIK